MVADRVVDAALHVLLAAQTVQQPGEETLVAQHRSVAAVDQPVVPRMGGAEEFAVLGRGAVAEERSEELGERVALLAEGPERVEPRAAEIHLHLIAEHRDGQRLAVAGEDAAPLCGQDLLGEDAAFEPAGVVVDLGAEHLHPHQTPEHRDPDPDEQQVEQPHAQQNVALDL